jgi:hypothetical protein
MVKKVENFYTYTDHKEQHNPHYGKSHHIEVPFRMIISGASSQHKTNTLLNLISRMDQTFDRIVVCCKSRNEPLYDILERMIPETEFHEDDVPPLPDDQSHPDVGSLIVFDDLVNSKEHQPAIADYYIRARKFGWSCVYITQSFFRIPITIRQQASHLAITQANPRDFNRIIKEFCLDMDLDDIVKHFSRIKKNDLAFMMVYIYACTLGDCFST